MKSNYKLLDFEACKDINILKNFKLVIWGGYPKGAQIKRTLEREGIAVECFCDSDIKKWNRPYEGLRIYSPYRLNGWMQNDADWLIVSCLSREKELVQILNEFNMENINLVSYWGISTAFIANGKILEVEDHLPIYDEFWRYECSHEMTVYHIRMLQNYRLAPQEAVKILTPGKTASNTILETFNQMGIPCIHIHTLRYPEYILLGELKNVWTDVFRLKRGEKTKIITSVREPLSRDFSAFWQPFSGEIDKGFVCPIFNGDFQKMYYDFIEIIMRGTVYAHNLLGITSPVIWQDEFEWFNYEIKDVFGIDVYEYPFNKEEGYQVIETDDVQIFLFRVENLDNILPALGRFVGRTIPSFVSSNIAETKRYGLAYKEFQKQIRLPEKYVEHYYKGNPYMDHFYSKEEQKKFLERWENQIC